MPDYIRTPRGDFVLRREVVRWVERDSPGWGDHKKIIVILRNGEELNTGMYAHEWLKEWEEEISEEG